MKLTGAFVAHEARTQWRSPRFRALSVAYIVIVSAPAVVPFVIARKGLSIVGPAMFSSVVDAVQALVTFVFAAIIAVDAISRERDEGSLGIVALAPISNAGYVLRRWLAIVIIALPVTLVPRAIAAALAWPAAHTSSAIFVAGWLAHALPQLVVGSLLGLALGTITGRTVLAAILGAALFTMGLELANDVLIHVKLRFAGPGDLLNINEAVRQSQILGWALRGYTPLRAPTEAGVDFREILEIGPAAALPLAVAALLIAIAPAFLRRSRADLRPWRIRDDHPLRTILRTFNRIREDYRPDPAPLIADRLTLATGIAVAACLVAWMSLSFYKMRDHFEEGYRALLSTSPMPTAVAMTVETVQLRGRVGARGDVHTSSVLTMRNGTGTPQSHFAFSIDPHLSVDRLQFAGRARVQKLWDRMLIDIDPPAAPGKMISFRFDVSGVPGLHPLESPERLVRRYGKHRRATTAFDMLDLSREPFVPAASSIGGSLRASELMPVPRYTAWTLIQENDGARVEPERITPATELTVAIDFPKGNTVVDSCGAVAPRSLRSNCAGPLADYLILAAPWKTMPLSAGARFAYIPLHEETARLHALAVDTAIRDASAAWPRLRDAAPPVIVERPRVSWEDSWWSDYAWLARGELSGSGSLMVVPEALIARKAPLKASIFAASLVANRMTARRRMLPQQQRFFHDFVFAVALGRFGTNQDNAVEKGAILPDTQAILHSREWSGTRLRKVLRDIEYRVGPDRVVSGIEEFVSARSDGGTAQELLRTIGRSANVSLDRVYSDYFDGHALPKLTLDGVTFGRQGERWVVSGRVVNRGTGEAVCPLVLRTALEPLRRVVRVDSSQEVPFVFETSAEPRAVQLDPERVCYRWATVGLVDNVENRSNP